MRFAEFCAGIGGFRLGITTSKSEARCVYRNEIDAKCEDTYYTNFYEKFDSKNIFDIVASQIPDFDMLCSGFPCQPFSIAGHQNGFQDERGKVFHKLSEIIAVKRPTVVFLENVPNLARHDKGNTLNSILYFFEKENYVVYKEILDSAEFGVPQSRPRLYVVAFCKDKVINPNFKFPKGTNDKKTIRDILAHGDYSIPISSKWEQYIDYYLGKISAADLLFDIPKTRKNLERIALGCDLDDCILQIRSSGIRAYALDAQFPTLAVSHSGGGAMIPVLTKERRHISVLEMQRLMGFPDDFCFQVARTDSIKQLANAVCPPVIQSIYEQIVLTLQYDG